MVEAFSPFFKDTGNHHDVEFTGKPPECFGRWSRNRFSPRKLPMVFALTEIRTEKQFRQADNLSTPSYCVANQLPRMVKVVNRILVAAHLDETYFDVPGRHARFLSAV